MCVKISKQGLLVGGKVVIAALRKAKDIPFCANAGFGCKRGVDPFLRGFACLRKAKDAVGKVLRGGIRVALGTDRPRKALQA